MAKKILVLSGSPKRKGNTAMLVDRFSQGAQTRGAQVTVIETAFLNYKALGCTSCRLCQDARAYSCVIGDEVQGVLAKMLEADVIVMATPLYFFSASTQIKAVFDRMFCLYKWDNATGVMETPLKGKAFVLIASAFEAEGLDALAKPFELTARYTLMKFESLLIANAGVSGDIKDKPDLLDRAFEFGKKVA